MYELNQIEIPPAFLALYCRNGRPLESRSVIEARHEFCDDLARQLAPMAQTAQANEGLSEEEVLRRCRAGLQNADAASELELSWVIHRTAELLDWPAEAAMAALA